MTITAGNSNNGIPMGGYVPGTGSGGGGGTVPGNVYKYKGSVDSYDLLPTTNLETGDVYNVANTGMNYAWTGAEWDALGATVDLSAYYDKTEVDAELVKKQDVLTPALPLEINTKQINASNNMTVQETGAIVSSNSAWSTNLNSNKTTFNYNTGSATGEYLFVRNASFDAVQKQLGCMVFPFTFGHIYTVPICTNENRDTMQHPAIALGYYNSEAEFVPVFTTTASVDEWAQFTTTTAVETEPAWDVWGFTTSSDGVYTNSISLGQPVEPWIPGYYTLYFQIFKTPEGNYSFTNAPHYANHLRCYTGDFISTMNPLLDKCTHIMLCAWSTDDAGVGVNNGIGAPAYNLSSNTFDFVYSGNLAEDIEADIFDYQNLKTTSENLFKLEALNITSLTLSIDNNTLKINSSNQLYADIDTTAAVATADTAGIVRPTGDVLSVNAEGDLSADTYNKSTLDTKFEEKQNILTATNGISIERKTISNVEGFSYTSDSSAIYNTGGWGVGAPLGQNWVVYQVPGIADLIGTSMTATTFPNRIVMPYNFGQIVKYPSVNAYTPINIAFGKLAEDGTFYPIWFPKGNRYYYKSDDNIIQKPGNFEQIHFYSYVDWGQNPENAKMDVFTYNNSVQYMQLKVTDSDLKLNYTYGVSNHSYMRQYYKTDVDILNRFREVNAIMIIPYYQIYSASSEKIGVDQDSAFPVTSIGLYANTMDLYDSAEQLDSYDFGENLFDIGGVQAHNYISINTDGSTIKVNDSGQLYAEASTPTNMVTTDIEQTITAKKVHTGATEFQGEVTFHTDSNQGLMFKTSNKNPVAGISCNTMSGNELVMDFGGVQGASNVIPRFICESDAQITNISGYNWGRILDTRNFNSRILAGDNITITKNGSGLDSTYTIASTASGGGSYTLPAATADTLGGIKVGSNLAVTDDGTLSATYIPATTTSLGAVKPDGTTVTIDEDGTIHSTQEGFADLAANNVFTGTNQFQSTVTVGNGFNTAVLNMGPGSGLIFNNSSQAGGKTLSLGTQTGTQVTIYSDGVPIIQRSETRTNQSSSDDNPYTKYNNVDSGNINDILGISFWKGTQTEYDGITEKDANTLYIITG